MLEISPELFREGVEIASVYGVFPPSLWNGGRVKYGVCSKDFVKGVIKAYNKRNIPLRFTFTNPMIEKKHLSDEFCNMVMHLADNGFNECIVMSPILEDYIRKNYPNYKLTSSGLFSSIVINIRFNLKLSAKSGRWNLTFIFVHPFCLN